jgi:hypothetical protein
VVDQRSIIRNAYVDLRARHRVSARRGRFQQFTPVWAEIESRIGREGTFPPSWFTLLVIAGLIGAVGILTNSEILIVGAMVVGPEYGAILSLAFAVTRRDFPGAVRSARALGTGFALAVVGALLLGLIVRWTGPERQRQYALSCLRRGRRVSLTESREARGVRSRSRRLDIGAALGKWAERGFRAFSTRRSHCRCVWFDSGDMAEVGAAKLPVQRLPGAS